MNMYSGSGYSDWEIGDVDVIIDNGIYHLFHLIIPNHDYIAHAVSEDGMSWKRVKNALFVGDPGEWDDDMLWTMHTFKDGSDFLMYYTGLQRRDRGVIQKIGCAKSSDLVNWEKSEYQGLPVGSAAPHYEDVNNNPRKWLSFRDPFRFSFEDKELLLFSGRQGIGPVSRRGCVGLMELVNGKFEHRKPLFISNVYDDIECPSLVKMNGYFYLIGSNREDIKVRYWFSPEVLDEYHAFHDNLLMPQGNYAARIVQDGEHILIYNYYYVGNNVNTLRVLPPPKELSVDAKGRLLLKSFYRWPEKVTSKISLDEFPEPTLLFSNPTASFSSAENHWTTQCRSGHELFCFSKPSVNIIWEGTLCLEGMGKCGLILDGDEDGNGYFISLDFVYGLIQIRSWGFNETDNHKNFIFENLQTNQFNTSQEHKLDFKLIRYGHYIEFAVNEVVKLTLIDYRYQGSLIGIYSSSSVISLTNSLLYSISEPESEYGAQESQVQKMQESMTTLK